MIYNGFRMFLQINYSQKSLIPIANCPQTPETRFWYWVKAVDYTVESRYKDTSAQSATAVLLAFPTFYKDNSLLIRYKDTYSWSRPYPYSESLL
jgi:hypothetical protein